MTGGFDSWKGKSKSDTSEDSDAEEVMKVKENTKLFQTIENQQLKIEAFEEQL